MRQVSESQERNHEATLRVLLELRIVPSEERLFLSQTAGVE
jgi:hypothetical protein